MGRNKLPLKKIDNPCRRKITYSKRRDGIIKKATELSVLCDTDVGVLMYSPHGRLTTFSSNGRTVEKEGYLYQNLKRLKHEKEMLEQIAKMEVLMEKVNEIRQKLQERREKMRSYNPDVVDINAILDANAHRQFLFDAIQNIEKLGMEIFHEPIDLQKSESLQVTLPATRDAHLTANELVYANGNRNLSQDDHQPKEAHLPVGPHLTLEYLRTQKHWNLQGRGQGNA